jgi:hypothetical protein
MVAVGPAAPASEVDHFAQARTSTEIGIYRDANHFSFPNPVQSPMKIRSEGHRVYSGRMKNRAK